MLPPNPGRVRLFGSTAVVTRAHGVAHAIQKLGRIGHAREPANAVPVKIFRSEAVGAQSANRDVANTASSRQPGHGRNAHLGGHATGPTPPGHTAHERVRRRWPTRTATESTTTMRRCLRAAARLSPRLSRQSGIESPAIAQRPLNQTQRLGATSRNRRTCRPFCSTGWSGTSRRRS